VTIFTIFILNFQVRWVS